VTERALPLEGIRVANFGWVWAGPVVGQTLAFLGAEVTRSSPRAIEMPRTLPPFADGGRDPSRSLSNHACWAGNGSVTLNLKKPEGIQLALALVAKSDAVIENFGPGVMEQLGLGYESLRAVRPDVILFSMPAAGLDGPLKDIRTYGLSLTSTTGLDSLTGYLGGRRFRSRTPSRTRTTESSAPSRSSRRCTIGAAPARASTSTTRSRRRSCRWSGPPSWTGP
jgi:benzylsuccinate CoA-transferase BbsF subunit